MSKQYIQAVQDPVFELIANASVKLGIRSYVIGGFVRDYILQRNVPKDIDIVAQGSGIELAKEVADLIPGHTKISVFKNFGTAMIRHKDLEVEFVGARKESYSSNSRKPAV